MSLVVEVTFPVLFFRSFAFPETRYKLCLSFGSCKDELCSLSLFVVKAKHKTPNIRMSFAHTQQEEVQQAASEVL